MDASRLAQFGAVAALTAGALTAVPASPAAVAAVAAAPGTYTGRGFDTCTAPSAAAMRAWLASPYRAVGIYFGGRNRACAQPQLTPGWVAAQQAAGWHLLPLYVGPQAPCTQSGKRSLIVPATAAAQGRAEAESAASAAAALGLPRESALVFDLEAYRTGDAGCRSAVLRFLSAWSARLHDLGYLSGLYSSMSSGIADAVASYATPFTTRPDYLDFARWDGVATVTDAAIPAGYWSPHRRIKQYAGGHNETWGGVTLNVDSDYLDVAPLPRAASGDWTGNGWPDLMTRVTSANYLVVYPGTGSALGSRYQVGSTGWNAMDAITRFGDFTRDGMEDLIAREHASGALWLYTGGPAGLPGRTRIGTGWQIMREITAAGDLSRDGYADLLAIQTAQAVLYLYPGHGNALAARIRIGSGWNTMDELTGAGDFNRDGYPDLVAREKATGRLFLYPGRPSTLAARVQIAAGWGGVRDITGVGDFDRDGYPDLVAANTSNQDVYLYRGRGNSLWPGLRIGGNWAGLQPLW
jgi:hypothetical protein